MCNSCSASFVKFGKAEGIVHEAGCPESYKDVKNECKECGCEFQPEQRGQKFCSEHCSAMYHGFHCSCESCQELYRETDYSGEDNDGFLLEETEVDEWEIRAQMFVNSNEYEESKYK